MSESDGGVDWEGGCEEDESDEEGAATRQREIGSGKAALGQLSS